MIALNINILPIATEIMVSSFIKIFNHVSFAFSTIQIFWLVKTLGSTHFSFKFEKKK